jgi:hypothetical protein
VLYYLGETRKGETTMNSWQQVQESLEYQPTEEDLMDWAKHLEARDGYDYDEEFFETLEGNDILYFDKL